nr:MAG TPA: hypothetical protein [Caudoviricetes sp.]
MTIIWRNPGEWMMIPSPGFLLCYIQKVATS